MQACAVTPPESPGRANQADPTVRDAFYASFDQMRRDIEATKPDALVVIAAEHFANFFMDNLPTFALGMADFYDAPHRGCWLAWHRQISCPWQSRFVRTAVSRKSCRPSMSATPEEWKFDHGIAVPLHFLTPNFDLPIIPANINCQGPPLSPLSRAWAFGEALRRAADALPERIALVGTGGISHWPATPDSGKINEPLGIVTSWIVGAVTTAMHCSTTTMARSTPMLAKAGSRSERSSR